MGSFTSTPKITTTDNEDDDIHWTLEDECGPLSLVEKCHCELTTLPSLLPRKFHVLSSETSNATFRILQWNALSQALGVLNDNFVACPKDALEWKTRRFRLIEEMMVHMPDILCLQEVDHYQFLRKTLEMVGFQGTFFPKPDSPCIYIQGNNGPDGCAIFFNNSKFELCKVETRIMEVWHVQSNQVAILVILRSRQTGQEICVVTTHLKARQGPFLSTLRNEQGKDLLEFIRMHYGGLPVVLCGDFNAEPTEPVYQTILKCEHLGLSSSYTLLSGNDSLEPPFTTWKIREDGEVCHTIDYIFYSKRNLSVNSLLQFPDENEIGQGRLPSLRYPSDHFSLVADFSLC